MKGNMKKIHLLAILVLLAAACNTPNAGNTSTGNPLVSLTVTGSGAAATVQYKSKSILEMMFMPRALALPPPSLYDSALNAVTVSEFWLGLKNVELKSTETATSGESSDVQLTGPFSVDLLASSPSSIGDLYAPSAGVRRFKARLEKVTSVPAGAPTELLTNSVVLKGTVSGHLFTVLLADGIDYEVAGPNLLNLQSGSRLLLSIQTANLIKKIDLSVIASDVTISASNRVPATNPCPTIDASASDLYTCFQSGIKTEANAGEDSSGNDEIDGSEGSVK